MLTIKIKGTVGTFDISTDIEAGLGVTALYGVSGAGKSSILRAVAGLWAPGEGMIEIGERRLFDSERAINVPVHKRGLGLVFQEPLIFPHMTVTQNLQYAMPKAKNDWDDVLELLDLKPLLDRRPRHLSGGEAQRVALGRALLMKPKALLLDEPLTGFDAPRREQIMPYLEQIRDETNVPIIYVSHNRDEILRLADLIFIVEDGVADREMSPAEFEVYSAVETSPRRDKV